MFYQYQFDPNPGVFPSFALDSAQGEGVYLSAADAGGHLTGYRVGVEFGAAENGVSLGRYTNSTGVEFVALSRRTFGVDNPATLAQFRTGTGLPNAYPQVGPVVINELMYQPVTVVGTELVEQPQEEFIELYNLSTNSVALFDPNYPANTWQLSGGIDFAFPAGTVLAAQSYLLVVGFDPVADPAALAAFQARFEVDAATAVLGPFQGRLSNEGEGIELYKPDAPSPAPEAGFVPWILADRVNYGITAPWPAAAAGGGASLQRRVTAEFGNDPLNWKAEPPTAGRTNAPPGFAPPVIASSTTRPDRHSRHQRDVQRRGGRHFAAIIPMAVQRRRSVCGHQRHPHLFPTPNWQTQDPTGFGWPTRRARFAASPCAFSFHPAGHHRSNRSACPSPSGVLRHAAGRCCGHQATGLPVVFQQLAAAGADARRSR